jgi:hypothetical protein
MLPGESRFVRTYTDQQVSGAALQYYQKAGDGIVPSGPWNVHFVEGGPALPKDYHTTDLASWTTRYDPKTKVFAGTARYTTVIDLPATAAHMDWVLDLGKVCESARVNVNGTDVGTIISAPFSIPVHSLFLPGHNTIQIDVTNLATNRIEDLDRRGVQWKIFRDINFSNHTYGGLFDASSWPLRDSGLIGPVTLTPMAHLIPAP